MQTPPDFEERDRYIDVGLQYRLREEYKKICEDNEGIMLMSEDDWEDTFDKVLFHVNKRMTQAHYNGLK